MTDKYLGGYKWEQCVLISQLAQLFYLFCLQQSEYGSSKINSPKIFNKVFASKGNLIAFIVKNINLGIIGEFFFGMDEKLYSLTFLIFRESLFEVSQLYTSCVILHLPFSSSVFKSLWEERALVSSAKRKNWSLLEQYWMSFISITKRSGPRTDPWGMPQLIFSLLIIIIIITFFL